MDRDTGRASEYVPLTESSSCSSFLTLDSEASFSTPVRDQPSNCRLNHEAQSSVGSLVNYGSVRSISALSAATSTTSEKGKAVKSDPLPSPILTKVSGRSKQDGLEDGKQSSKTEVTTDPRAAELKLKKDKKLVKLVSEVVLQIVKKYARELGNDLTTECVKEVSHDALSCRRVAESPLTFSDHTPYLRAGKSDRMVFINWTPSSCFIGGNGAEDQAICK